MENPFENVNYERENETSATFYNKGYFEGYNKGLLDANHELKKYLCSLSDEELIKWRDQNKIE